MRRRSSDANRFTPSSFGRRNRAISRDYTVLLVRAADAVTHVHLCDIGLGVVWGQDCRTVAVLVVVSGRVMEEVDILGGCGPGRCARMVVDVICASGRIVPEFSSY